MKKASITEAKNNLSKLIQEVKRGNSILIMDRRIPVAILEPLYEGRALDFDWTRVLIREGLAAGPRRSLDVEHFLNRKKAKLTGGKSAVRTLLEEREESL